MNKVIQVSNICKTLNGHKILRNISMHVDEGEICGLVGRNASGKSMLFKAICGLIRIDSGEIRVWGEKIGGKRGAFPRSTGAIIEHPGFLPQYSGFTNLKLLADIQRLIGDREIRESLEAVGLNPDDKRPFRKYSLGMRQKLSIAQAIMEKPKLLILDEPMNNLDEESTYQIRNLLAQLNANGATILLSSHNNTDIDVLCNRVLHIDKGMLENKKVGEELGENHDDIQE